MSCQPGRETAGGDCKKKAQTTESHEHTIHPPACSRARGDRRRRRHRPPQHRHAGADATSIPFLMLDHFGSDNPDEYIAGFPDHPHRGFITFTYMLDGHMEHRDSMGNRGDLKAGGVQWMKAASGVIHSEMPQQTNGLMRGFQLWINLPASEKMSDSGLSGVLRRGHSGGGAGAWPGAGAGRRIRRHARRHRRPGHRRALPRRQPGRRCPLQAAAGDHASLPSSTSSKAAPAWPAMPWRSTPWRCWVRVTRWKSWPGEPGARFILVAGRPIGEPVVQYGPFVMNTREEIEQAFADYRAGRLVQTRASMSGQLAPAGLISRLKTSQSHRLA